MVYFYFKQAFRNFVRSRFVTLGSLLTIFLGTLSISLLFSYVHNELSMDKFNRRHKDIYIMIMQATPQAKWDVFPCSYYFDFTGKEYPEIEGLTSIKKFNKNEIKFTYNNSVYFPEGIATDSVFFRVFSYRIKVGTYKSASNPNTILLTESFAKKLFGKEDPLGKTIVLRAGFEDVYTVCGIMEDPPSNSSIKFEFLLYRRSGEVADIILTRPGFDKEAFLQKIEKIPQQAREFRRPMGKIGLLPFDDVHFPDGQINLSLSKVFIHPGDKDNIKILVLVMIILLAVSALNFSNLQIVNINSSIKNIGINKIAGADGKHLFFLKLAEIVWLTGLATILSTIAYLIVLPLFNKLTETSLSPQIYQIILLNLGIISTMILISLIYPTLLILKLPINTSLKNQLIANNRLMGRQIIIVIQFVLAIGLLVASFVVTRQLDMMLHKDLGFYSENIIKTQFIKEEPFPAHPTKETIADYKKRWDKQRENNQVINDELSANTTIEAFSQLQSPIEAYLTPWGIDDGSNKFDSQYTLEVTPTHLSVFDFILVAGRFFDPAIDRFRGQKVVVNEAALKYWGIEDISKTRLKDEYMHQSYEIIGVVKDFNFRHLSAKPQPLVMYYSEGVTANHFIRFKPEDVQQGLVFVKKLHDQFVPGEPFNYTFLTDEVAALYQKDKRLSQIYILFTLIAFFISMSGLFTIALFDTAKRTKEIGVRKVNGATISEILAMLNKDFVKWVILAFIIASPIAWYTMHQWLENFAYKTELSWWIFALAGILALGIALLTVSWQSWKAATRNPVEALRYE